MLIRPDRHIIEYLLSANYKIPRYILYTYKIEPASYYGFVLGDLQGSEIMYCVREHKGTADECYMITPLKGPNPEYKAALTKEGWKQIHEGPKSEYDKFLHFAYFERLAFPSVVHANPDFWEELFAKNIFKYWTKGGPLKYSEVSSLHPSIGLSRVFRTSLLRLNIIPEEGHHFRDVIIKLKNSSIISREIISTAVPILSDSEYAQMKIAIYDTIKKYVPRKSSVVQS